MTPGTDMKFVVVNSGVGNVRSVANMLKRAKTDAAISDDPEIILAADALLLPGVGSFDAAIRRLRQAGLMDALNEKVLQQNTPILGLCLGMQLMASSSEEGEEPGFNWIPGHLTKISPVNSTGERIRVPHMGWNIPVDTKNMVLYDNMGDEPRFYFDHSYCFMPENEANYCGRIDYGRNFAAGIRQGNIFGVQFHPEKSHRFGLAMFKNFVNFAKDPAKYGGIAQ